MIYSHTMMSGYLCLQGSYMFHIPMLIAMLIFVRVPQAEDQELAFPEEGNWLTYWYWGAVTMHVCLSVTNLVGNFIDELGPLATSTFLWIQNHLAIAEMFNLCVMMHHYSVHAIDGKYVDDVESFKFWLLIEIYMIISTVMTAALFMLTRSCSRGALEFYVPIQDDSQDFLSNQVTLMILANAMAIFGPPISNGFFYYNFGVAHDAQMEYGVTTESLEMLKV